MTPQEELKKIDEALELCHKKIKDLEEKRFKVKESCYEFHWPNWCSYTELIRSIESNKPELLARFGFQEPVKKLEAPLYYGYKSSIAKYEMVEGYNCIRLVWVKDV